MTSLSRAQRNFRAIPNVSAIRVIVRKMIGDTVETKQKLINLSLQAIQDSARTPLNYQLMDVAQGDTQITRNGNQVWLTGIYLSGYLTVSDTTNVVRMTVYEPRGDASATPGWSTATAIDPDEYTIYTDKRFTVDTYNPIKLVNYRKSWTRKGKARGRRVVYGSTGSTDVQQGNVYVRFVSDSTAIGDPSFTGEIRAYFKDP